MKSLAKYFVALLALVGVSMGTLSVAHADYYHNHHRYHHRQWVKSHNHHRGYYRYY